MKWYSVKKYKPPMQIQCLIFTENNYIYAARLVDNKNKDIWAHDYTCEECGSNHELIYGVTHFCIPDPIEIEE